MKPLGTTTAGLLALASVSLLGACEDESTTTAPYGASCAAPAVQDPDFQTVTPWSRTGAATLNVTVPAPAGTAGPALKFWYKTSAITHAGLSVTMSALSAVVALPAAADWTQARACLQPNLAGRPDVLTFGVAGSGGDCTTAFPPETLAIDDVELTTDSTCPAQ